MEVMPVISLADVRSKINMLRTSFLRELKKVNDSTRSGAGVDTYKPKIWYYEELSFIAEKSQMIRNSLSALDDVEKEPAESAAFLPSLDIATGEIEKHSNDTNVDQDIMLDDVMLDDYSSSLPSSSKFLPSSSLPSSSQTTSAKKRRLQTEAVPESRQLITSALHETLHAALHETLHEALHDTLHETLHEELHETLHDYMKSHQTCKPTEKPSHETFGNMVSQEMKDLPAKQLLFCKKVINDAIFQASMGRLTEFSTIISIQENKLENNIVVD